MPLALTLVRSLIQQHDTCQPPKEPYLNELVSRIQWQEWLDLGKSLVHVVNREVNSIDHLRKLANYRWLTCCKQDSTLLHDGKHQRTMVNPKGLNKSFAA